MSKYATEKGGKLQDLDELFKAGSGPGATYFYQEGQDLAQRYAPLVLNKLPFNTGFIARGSNKDLTELFEARPPQAPFQWRSALGAGDTPQLPQNDAGDLIFVLVYNKFNTAPDLAAGWTSAGGARRDVDKWGLLAYKYSSGAEPAIAWGNVSSWVAVVIKGSVNVVDVTIADYGVWAENRMSNPGRNIGLHLGGTWTLDKTITPYPDSTPLIANQLVDYFMTYVSYTGLANSLPQAPFGGNTADFCVGWSVELQPLLPFVPEVVANTSRPNGAAGGTVQMPPHAPGDLLIVAAGRNDQIIPSVSDMQGYGLVSQTPNHPGVNSAIIAKFAATNNEGSGIWANATSLIGLVMKGAGGILASAAAWNENTGLGWRMVYPALELQSPGRSSILTIGFSGNQISSGLPGPGSLQVIVNDKNTPQAFRADGSTSTFDRWDQVALQSGGEPDLGWSLEIFVNAAPPVLSGTVVPGYDGVQMGFFLNNFGSWTGVPPLSRLLWQADGKTYLLLEPLAMLRGWDTLKLTIGGQGPFTFYWYPDGRYYTTGQGVNMFDGLVVGTPYAVELVGASSPTNRRARIPTDMEEPPPKFSKSVTESIPVKKSKYL